MSLPPTWDGASEKRYYNAERGYRLRHWNSGDSTTGPSGSSPVLHLTSALSGLKVCHSCWLPTLLAYQPGSPLPYPRMAHPNFGLTGAQPRPPDPLIHRCLRRRVSVPCLPPLRNWPSLARYWLLRLRQLFGLYGRECGDSSSSAASKDHCPNGLPHPGTDSCRNSWLAAIMGLR